MTDVDVAREAGNALFKQSRYLEARDRYLEAIQLSAGKDFKSYCNLAAVDLLAGKPFGSYRYACHATQIAPDFARGWHRLGQAALALGLLEQAEGALQRAASLAEGSFSTAEDVTRVLSAKALRTEAERADRAGNAEAAHTAAKKLLEQYTPGDIAALTHRMHQLVCVSGQLEEAEKRHAPALRQALEDFRRAEVMDLPGSSSATPFPPEAIAGAEHAFIELLQARGRFQEAAAQLHAMLQRSPDLGTQYKQEWTLLSRAGELKQEGNQLFGQGKWRDAYEVYSRALELSPGNAVLLTNRAAAALHMGDASEGEADALAALSSDRAYSKAYQRLGEARGKLGNHLGALEAWEKVIRLEGTGQGSRGYAAALVGAGRRPESNQVVHVSSEEEFRRLVASPLLTVVDLMAPWCGPCKAIGPRMAQLAPSVPHVNLLKVDVDKLPQLAQGVQGVPTFRFYRFGQPYQGHEFSGADWNRLTQTIQALAG